MNILTLFSLCLTVAVYIAARKFAEKFPSPFTIPLVTASAFIIIFFLLFDISYEEYGTTKSIITYMLGPATVALAVPMYMHREIIKEKFWNVLCGILIGTCTTIFAAVSLSKVLHLSETIQTASAVKAITTPVAIDTVKILDGDPTLAATFVVASGITGAIMGSAILNFFRIHDPLARGLGMGTVSHGIGTSQALNEGSLHGAAASVAMSVAAIMTSILLPLVYRLFV
ncbi:LrgB family protein [Cytobacillus gottheilii]|uniref:LrgB family protein n=1 Tax=Cytobacillus gottheilii TaxID=859144 RepID=UPI002494112B|nr:LrgB family protein [Cytobacillus gottheilii]